MSFVNTDDIPNKMIAVDTLEYRIEWALTDN